MTLYLLFRTTIGGEPEDSSGIDTIVASGSMSQAASLIPGNYNPRELTEDDNSYLEFNVGEAYRLVEITSPGKAEVLSTIWLYPAKFPA